MMVYISLAAAQHPLARMQAVRAMGINSSFRRALRRRRTVASGLPMHMGFVEFIRGRKMRTSDPSMSLALTIPGTSTTTLSRLASWGRKNQVERSWLIEKERAGVR